MHTALTLFSLLPLLSSPVLSAHIPRVEHGVRAIAVNVSAGVSSESVASSSTSASSTSSLSAVVTSSTSGTYSSSGSTTVLSTTITIANSTSTTSASTSTTSSAAATTASYTPPSGLTYPSVTANPSITASSYKTLTSLIPSILTNSEAISTHSWELGALTETLLEVYNPSLTPFHWGGITTDSENIPWDMLDIAIDTLVAYNWTGAPSSTNDTTTTTSTSNSSSSSNSTITKRGAPSFSTYLNASTAPTPLVAQALIDGAGALGDPVSLVPAVWVLAHYADVGEVRSKLDARSGEDYAWAVGNQVEYLFDGPTSDNGTLSQREASFELWADMGFMITPSLAFLGLTTSSYDLLNTAISQWALETSALLDTTVNIYRHINDWDARLWATGNAWMLYGFMRNIAAVQASDYASYFTAQIQELDVVVASVFTAVFSQLGDDNLVPDYMLQSNATLAVGDASGTALTVAAFYRFQALAPEYVSENMTSGAERAFDGVAAKVDSDGWLTHAVDPEGTYGWVVYPNDTTLRFPEGQSFLALMWQARTDAGC